jgi:hypothetical protein
VEVKVAMFEKFFIKRRITNFVDFKIASALVTQEQELTTAFQQSIASALVTQEQELTTAFQQSIASALVTQEQELTTAFRLRILYEALADLVCIASNRVVTKSDEITVVIPTKDRPNSLSAALKSIENQTVSPAEVVVVNDGRKFTDDEEFTIKQTLSNLKNLTIIDSNSIGASGARELGLSKVRTRIVTYLDDDNLMWPTWIQSLHENFNLDSDDLLYGVQIRSEMEGGIHFQTPYDPGKIRKYNYIDSSTIAHKVGVGAWDSSVSVWNDWDFILSVASKNLKIRSLEKISSVYLTDIPNRITTAKKRITPGLDILEKYKSWIESSQ